MIVGRAWRWPLLVAGIPCLAQALDHPWQLGGFGTLGVMGTNTDQAGFYRDLSQQGPGATDHPNARTDSRLGLQAVVPISGELEATVQVVSRYRWDGTFKPDVNWAFLKWNPLGDLVVRAGRLGVEFSSMGDARDVGYAFLPVRPPPETPTMFMSYSFDGLDLASTFPLAGGLSLRTKMWAGSMVGKVPIAGGVPLDLDGNPMGGLVMQLSGSSWWFRFCWETVTIKHDWPAANGPTLPQLLDPFAAALQDQALYDSAQTLTLYNARNRYAGCTFTWDRGPLQAQVEVDRGTSNRALEGQSWTGVATLGWRLGNVEPYGLLQRIVSDHPTLDLGALPTVPVVGPQFAAVVPAVIRETHVGQNTVALGVRWDFAPSVCLKLQADQDRALAGSNGFFYRIDPSWDGRARVFSATLDFVFGRGQR